MQNQAEKVWLFRFALESEDGEMVGQEVPEALLDYIVRWAEKRGCQIGGGYRHPSKDELNDVNDEMLIFPSE